MANTLTGLIPSIYAGMDIVSRELTGFIPAVTLDASLAQAAKDQTISSFATRSVTASDLTPSMTLPSGTAQTIDANTMTISKVRSVEIPWQGEEFLSVSNGGQVGASRMLADQFAQAVRALVNEMESDLAALHTTASRGYGTAGTTPFGTAGDFQDATFTAKILKDNGAPLSDMQLVIDTAAGAKMSGLQSRYDIAGETSMQRQGIILSKAGFDIRESAQIVTSTAGTGSSATTDAAGYAIGATTITLASAGTGTIVAGDIITFAGDTNKYVVLTGDSNVANGGSIVLAAPGLRKAIAATATNITVTAASARNMAFSRSAIVLATRLPALVGGRDAAIASEVIVDPRTGMAFDVRQYVGDHMAVWKVSAAWGVKNFKPAHTAILLG